MPSCSRSRPRCLLVRRLQPITQWRPGESEHNCVRRRNRRRSDPRECDAGPYSAGHGGELTGPGIGVIDSGAVVALGHGIAVGQLRLTQQQATTGQPVRLALRPAPLSGREELLTQLDTWLAAGDGLAPRTVALYGLGGAGKTSVAVEYAYRHLNQVGVAWQFSAEDAMVLAAEFSELAARTRRPRHG